MLGIKAFLSHAHSNKEIVLQVKNELDKHGILTWLDELQIGIGDSIRREIESGIVSSNFLLIFLSKSAVKSEWVGREIDIAFTREIESKDTMIIPILLEDCEIPPSLKPKRYLDLRSDYEVGIKTLIETLNYPRKTVLRAITGRWVGETGSLYLATTGNLIIGKYDWRDEKSGNIFGHLEKNRIKFNWTWDLSTESGMGVFDINDTYQLLEGGWWFKDAEIDPDVDISQLRKNKKINIWSFEKASNTALDQLALGRVYGNMGYLYRPTAPERRNYRLAAKNLENAIDLFNVDADLGILAQNKKPKKRKKKK